MRRQSPLPHALLVPFFARRRGFAAAGLSRHQSM
ncbi:hypothetical protein RLDS_11555 [Sphingobium lactosutens DS20]|uniref:Uncharacterized protein n=1 Tax=Sphingobium lactosutens DS20 TaxID=1331060 RepID=T0HFG0_9SPHN|nr:hypothetical protein RLDS_11555 [Sphingobium lactosutens DS20]